MANRIAVLETNKGTIRFELLEEDAPKTTENFRLLAEKGYYDGVIFHRVINGFMIQGGDAKKNGSERGSPTLNRMSVRLLSEVARHAGKAARAAATTAATSSGSVTP